MSVDEGGRVPVAKVLPRCATQRRVAKKDFLRVEFVGMGKVRTFAPASERGKAGR